MIGKKCRGFLEAAQRSETNTRMIGTFFVSNISHCILITDYFRIMVGGGSTLNVATLVLFVFH